MVALNLQLAKLDVEVLHKIFKQILVITHQLHSNFLCKNLRQVLLWLLKVGEQENKNLFSVTRDFYEVNFAVQLVEVPVKHFSLGLNAELIVTDVHRWRSFLCDDVYRVTGCHNWDRLLVTLDL